ncbi:hypothetical protein [Sporisorium scitamineum]|uniref:Uncharacterized protein n=1 Tax=Sporisorium scitamineum TaxID=49012 RepID=A0A0F7SBV5_9BASI|nr:hypothetical protein [Sporisorium scitamineum]
MFSWSASGKKTGGIGPNSKIAKARKPRMFLSRPRTTMVIAGSPG